MQRRSTVYWLVVSIGMLALVAAGAGLFWPFADQPYVFTTLRGETVTIVGRGLYRYETVGMAVQAQAQDLVTLVVGLPQLAVSALLAYRGSLRGRLLLSGTLGYFLYTYTSMAFGAAYNQLFLVYVALFSLSLYAFVLSMLSFDLAELPRHFSPRLPRRSIAGVLFAAGTFCCWPGSVASCRRCCNTGRPPVWKAAQHSSFRCWILA